MTTQAGNDHRPIDPIPSRPRPTKPIGMTLRRRDMLLGLGLATIMPVSAYAIPMVPRRIALKNQNTGETFTGPYRDTAGPIPEALADLTIFLRDFHANELGPVDVGVLDFLGDVMSMIGETQATVLSAYRTKETNARLRARSFGVAENSMHLVGRAVDVSFDTKLAYAEETARAMSRGGVGWYPQSHFIHLDSGPTRNWQLGGRNLMAGISVNGVFLPHYKRPPGGLPIVIRGHVGHFK
jgi:uncharacterized protein YcbK (DUF882 family)